MVCTNMFEHLKIIQGWFEVWFALASHMSGNLYKLAGKDFQWCATYKVLSQFTLCRLQENLSQNLEHLG